MIKKKKKNLDKMLPLGETGTGTQDPSTACGSVCRAWVLPTERFTCHSSSDGPWEEGPGVMAMLRGGNRTQGRVSAYPRSPHGAQAGAAESCVDPALGAPPGGSGRWAPPVTPGPRLWRPAASLLCPSHCPSHGGSASAWPWASG